MSLASEVIDYLNSDWEIGSVNPKRSRVTIEMDDLVQMIADFARLKVAETLTLNNVILPGGNIK